jgi:hypothetical protein
LRQRITPPYGHPSGRRGIASLALDTDYEIASSCLLAKTYVKKAVEESAFIARSVSSSFHL